MPIEHSIWKINKTPSPLPVYTLDNEDELEEMLFKDLSILNDQWLLIGRQVQTSFNKYVDLLALDASGSLIIIELKKKRTARETVAQAIDYASWIETIDTSTIAEIYEKFCSKYLNSDMNLNSAFLKKFGSNLDEDDLNSSHQIVIVASELDSSTERIVQYLSNSEVPINIVFFQTFRDGENKYLSRAWLIDPAETQKQATIPQKAGPWNGEFYVSFGVGENRNWEDARKFDFICAGGGKWYSNTLNMLQKGDRIWANVPKVGYVGVGVVAAPAVKIDEFYVQTEKDKTPFLEAPINANYHQQWKDNDDKSEYFVKVNWIKTVPLEKAISEVGFFGNQNSVCKPTTPKWNHTVERLQKIFEMN